MEVFVADADRWSRVMRAMSPKVFVVGLGPALNLVGKDDSALRAIEDNSLYVYYKELSSPILQYSWNESMVRDERDILCGYRL